MTITNTPNGVKTEIVTSLAKSTAGGILVNSDGLGKELIKDEFNKAVDGIGTSSSSSILKATNFNEIHDGVVKDEEARYVVKFTSFYFKFFERKGKCGLLPPIPTQLWTFTFKV